MMAPWDPQSEFQALKARFLKSLAIADFATAPIEPKDVCNMLIVVILAMVVF